MENQAENSFRDEVEGQNARPQFLQVLCILSFILIAFF